MSMLISSHYSIGVYSSEAGIGKSSLVKRLLANIPHLRLLSTGERRSLLRTELFVDHQSILHHGKISRERKFLLWIEDLHPRDSDLLRSWTEEDFTWLFTARQPFSSYSNRFSRHFVPICLNESLSNLIDSIYSIPIRDWLEEFPVDAINHPVELAHACLFTLEEIFDFLRRTFLKMHWNLHQVEAIVNGMFLLDGKIKRTTVNNQLNLRYPKKKQQQDEQTATIVRLLIHEISRTILDRLTDTRGKTNRTWDSLQSLSLPRSRSTSLPRVSLQNDHRQFLYWIGIPHRQQSGTGQRLLADQRDEETSEIQTRSGCWSSSDDDAGRSSGASRTIDRHAESQRCSEVDQSGGNHRQTDGVDILLQTDSADARRSDQRTSEFHQSIPTIDAGGDSSRSSILPKSLEDELRLHSSHLPSVGQSRSSSLHLSQQSPSPPQCFARSRPRISRSVRRLDLSNGISQRSFLRRSARRGSIRSSISAFCLSSRRSETEERSSSRSRVSSLRSPDRSAVHFHPGGNLSRSLFQRGTDSHRCSTLSWSAHHTPSEQNQLGAQDLLRSHSQTTAFGQFWTTVGVSPEELSSRQSLHFLDGRHTGLFSSCYVEEYRAWNEDELGQIVQYWLNSNANEFVQQAYARVYLKMNELQLFTLRNLRKSVEFFTKFSEELRQRQKVKKAEREGKQWSFSEFWIQKNSKAISRGKEKNFNPKLSANIDLVITMISLKFS